MSSKVYSYRMREEAFDLFCTGLSRREVHDRLTARFGDEAPGDATLKRWSVADRWVARRNAVIAAWQQRQDGQRSLVGAEFLAELQLLRGKLLADARNLPVTTGESACFALAALERVIARIQEQEEIRQRLAAIRPVFDNQLQQLRSLIPPLSPLAGIEPFDDDDDPELLPE